MNEFEICRRRTHEEEVAVRRAQRNRQLREYAEQDSEFASWWDGYMRGQFNIPPLTTVPYTLELPGTWDASDFTGGLDEVRP